METRTMTDTENDDPAMFDLKMFVSVKYDDSNVFDRFLAIVELNLVPFASIPSLFYPCHNRFPL